MSLAYRRIISTTGRVSAILENGVVAAPMAEGNPYGPYVGRGVARNAEHVIVDAAADIDWIFRQQKYILWYLLYI
jgi:hypothetical protein